MPSTPKSDAEFKDWLTNVLEVNIQTAATSHAATLSYSDLESIHKKSVLLLLLILLLRYSNNGHNFSDICDTAFSWNFMDSEKEVTRWYKLKLLL